MRALSRGAHDAERDLRRFSSSSSIAKRSCDADSTRDAFLDSRRPMMPAAVGGEGQKGERREEKNASDVLTYLSTR